MFFTAYQSHSTPAGSGVLLERQLAGIFGGHGDCEELESVEGCWDDYPSLYNVTDRALDWNPPVKGENDPNETTEQFSKRYLDSRPDCPDDIESRFAVGPSASGSGAESTETVHCHFIRQYSRSGVVENARAMGKFEWSTNKTECVEDEDTSRHCVVCTLGGQQSLGGKQQYECSDDE